MSERNLIGYYDDCDKGLGLVIMIWSLGIENQGLELVIGIGDWDLDWVLGLGIEIGDWDWGSGLGIGIGDRDW